MTKKSSWIDLLPFNTEKLEEVGTYAAVAKVMRELPLADLQKLAFARPEFIAKFFFLYRKGS